MTSESHKKTFFCPLLAAAFCKTLIPSFAMSMDAGTCVAMEIGLAVVGVGSRDALDAACASK